MSVCRDSPFRRIFVHLLGEVRPYLKLFGHLVQRLLSSVRLEVIGTSGEFELGRIFSRALQMADTVQAVSHQELLELVDEQRHEVREFIDWAEGRETTNQSMYLAKRIDISEAMDAALIYPDKWWGVVVFTCFGCLNSTQAVRSFLGKPVDPESAKKLLDRFPFTSPKVGHHRKQATLRGAKTALVQACKNSDLLCKLLNDPSSFDARYRILRAADLDQWGRTTCFDLFVRAGAIGIGGQKYEPKIAYLADSTGPKAGFRAVWGRDVTRATAAWCEGLLQAWHRNWRDVIDRVGARWSGTPYASGDLENALCIYRETPIGTQSCTKLPQRNIGCGGAVSTARELFLGSNGSFVMPGDEIAYARFCQAAVLWRAGANHFSAGMAMLRASDAAWGNPNRMLEAQLVAISDFERVVTDRPTDSVESIAAIHKLIGSLCRTTQLFNVDHARIRTRIRELRSELAQRLLGQFGNSEHADNYLVRGFLIATDLNGAWRVEFPAYEVHLGTERFGEELILSIPSAFHIFIGDGDWRGAHEIVKLHASAFSTPGLKGWRAVTLAHLEPENTVFWFDEASEAFAKDSQPLTAEESIERGGSWSSLNQQLWAKYFRARARVVESVRSPENVKSLLASAAESLVGTESGWRDGDVSRFRVLINVLAKLVSDPKSFSVEEARREYQFEIRISTEETEGDRLALTFISEAAAAFNGFETDPVSELTRNHLGVALDALTRIPTIGPDVADAVRPEIGRSALAAVLGPMRTWMHRALGSIANEAPLRRILLRLLQAGLPLYVQVRHGPIEYGRDIVVLLQIDGADVLRQYQVKCGDIDKKKWRESKDEIEETFLVPLSSFQLPIAPDRIESVLVTNGHANPYVEPVMEGWFQDQRENQRRHVEFMHLDGLVDWIAKHRLVNELRAALQEQGIDIGGSSTDIP